MPKIAVFGYHPLHPVVKQLERHGLWPAWMARDCDGPFGYGRMDCETPDILVAHPETAVTELLARVPEGRIVCVIAGPPDQQGFSPEVFSQHFPQVLGEHQPVSCPNRG